MFGISIALIVLVIGLGVTWWHGRYKLGQVLFGVMMGLLLASVAPGLATTTHNAVQSFVTSIEAIHWGG